MHIQIWIFDPNQVEQSEMENNKIFEYTKLLEITYGDERKQREYGEID